MQPKPQTEPNMDQSDEEFWASFSEEERLALDQAIAEADAGLGIPHEEVMEWFMAELERMIAAKTAGK